MQRSPLVALLTCSFLGGCASTSLPPSLPVTSFASENCASAPDLSTAVSLLPEKNRAIWSVRRPVDEASPCIDWEGTRGPYLLFALPEVESGNAEEPGPAGTWRGPIEIGGVLEAARLFSPHVVMLDAEGHQTRVFAPEHYQIRAPLYSVQLQPQAGERFALVTINPVRIGGGIEGISTGLTSTLIFTGYGATNWISGVERRISSGFSYFGGVTANVYRPVEEETEQD